jgi:RHS repeat-associated protein
MTRRTEEDLDGAGPLTNPVTTFSYDLVDNMRSLTDPLGNTTAYAYDDLDRLLTETIELGPGNFVSRQLQYDLMNNLVRRTDRNDRVTEFTYDAIYRRIEESWLDAGDNVIHTIQFGFDEASQLLRAEDLTAGSRYDYTYDDLSRVTQSQVTNGGPAVTLSHVYDANSRRTDQFATVGGNADFHNSYFYDALNRLSRLDQVAQAGGTAVAPKRVDFGYNPDDQFVSIARFKATAGLPSDLVVQSNFNYDGIGRLTDMTYDNPTSTVVDFDWSFDAASRLTQFVSSVDGVSDYAYDSGDQLTAATHAAQTDEAYEYDENGNRTSTGYTTGFYNRLSSDGTYNYEYDAEGNRTKRTNINTGAVTEYTWDHRNRLVTVTDRAGDGGPITQIVNHRYDVFNRWISKQVDPDGAGPQPAAATRYHYDGDQLVLELDDSETVTHRYLWGPAVDQLLADEQATGEVLWAITDHLGSVRDLVDADGNVVNHIVYDSFGNAVSETNAAIDHLFGFTGRPFDESTGLQNNLNRWYDPQAGRWLSEDPIGFAAGDASLYRYVGNDPLTGRDPSGFVIKETHAFAQGFNQGIRTGLGNFKTESVSLLKTALEMANMIRYGTVAGAARIGELITGKNFTLDDAALQIARDIKSNSRGIRAFENAATAIGQALSDFQVSDYYNLARDIAAALGDAAKDWANEFERRMDQGCYAQAGEMLGEIIGEMLPELLFGSKGLKHFCFAAGTQVVVVDDAAALAAALNKLPPESDSANTGWNRRYVAAALGCSVVTVGVRLAACHIRRRTDEEQEPKPTAETRADAYFRRFGVAD